MYADPQMPTNAVIIQSWGYIDLFIAFYRTKMLWSSEIWRNTLYGR